VTEVLSGDTYQPLAGSSPQQIWSSAMVISPVLRGMLGFQIDAQKKSISLAPHIPAGWNTFAVKNVIVNEQPLAFSFTRNAEEISLIIDSEAANSGYSLVFAPEISLRAQVISANVNGRPIQFHIDANSADQHVAVTIPIQPGQNTIRIRLKDDFALGITNSLPELGSESHGLHIISTTWTASRDGLSVQMSGVAGGRYDLDVRNIEEIQSIEGADLVKIKDEAGKVSVLFPTDGKSTHGYLNKTVTIHFKGSAKHISEKKK
jgi:hypothetical protein